MAAPGTIRFSEIASNPSTPPVGYASIFIKTDNVLYIIDSSGMIVPLGSASSITSLTGDVTGSGPGAAATTVQFVGGQSASNVAAATVETQAATAANVVSTIVKRDSSGNFAANVITAALNGNASTSTASVTAISFTGPLAGDVSGHQSTTSVDFVGGKTSTDIANAVTEVDAATPSNIASTLVQRDASGNFAASIITAALVGNASTSTNFLGSLSGDVTGTQSATSIASVVVTAKLLTGLGVGSNTPIVSTDSILVALEKLQAQISGSIGAAITALTGDVSATGPGSVSSTVNSVGGSSAANIHSAEVAANAATPSNTFSTIVERDASGNFSATTITSSLTGDVTGNLFGNATTSTSFTGSLSGDVTGTQSATAIASATVTAKLLTGYVVGSNTAITASDSILSALEKIQGQINATTGAAITALTGDVVATGPGSVSSTIQANVVSNSKLAQMPADTLKGNNTGAPANASDLTVAQVAAMVAGTPITQTPNNANAPGIAGTLALSDHVHNIPTATPLQIGTSNSQGTAASFSNSDHIHAHGAQTDQTLHAIATDLLNGFMSAADKIKLDAATALNTPSTLVFRDSSGNFAAGTITANLTGNASGSSSSFTGSLAGDITGTQSTTNVAKIQGTTVSGTTGAGNVAFSASPTFTGTISAAALSMTAALTNTFSSVDAVVLNTTSFIFDTVNNSLGIGVQPQTSVMIDGVNTTGASKLVQMTGYGTGSTTGYRGRFARGTMGTPTAAQTGDILSAISGRGYGASQFAAASTGVMNIVAGEAFTNTSNATYVTISTTPTGSVTSAEAIRINSTSNVLIGTTTDNANDKLQVNGGVTIAQALKITGFTLTDAANIATDASKSNTFTVTLGGNRNLSAPTNPTADQKITYRIKQDSTGGRGLTFDAVFNFGSLVPAFTPSTAANATDYLGCIYNGSTSKWDVVALSKGF